MCFHSKQSKEAKVLEKRFKAEFNNPLSNFLVTDHINGFMFPKTPVITNKEPELIKMYNWGLIPGWAKDNTIRQYTLNAKIETVAEKPSFRNSINKRCLILADGFYEWKWLDNKGKSKEKYLITLPNDEPFAFAGIWSEWVDKSTGEIIDSYSILTTEANPLMAEIHNIKKRMPVILRQEDELKWLEKTPIEQFAYPYEINELTAVVVN